MLRLPAHPSLMLPRPPRPQWSWWIPRFVDLGLGCSCTCTRIHIHTRIHTRIHAHARSRGHLHIGVNMGPHTSLDVSRVNCVFFCIFGVSSMRVFDTVPSCCTPSASPPSVCVCLSLFHLVFAQEFAALKSRVQLLQASEAVASSTIAAADERVASLQAEKATLVAVSALLLPFSSPPRSNCDHACSPAVITIRRPLVAACARTRVLP